MSNQDKVIELWKEKRTKTDMENISRALLIAGKYSLTVEVMNSALKLARENPKKSTAQVMLEALLDWDL